MDQKRRTLLLGASALPLGLSLTACGGGAGKSPDSPDAAGLAQASSTKPYSGPYIEVVNTDGTVNPEWTSVGWLYWVERLRYLVAPTGVTHGVTNLGVHYIEINDVVSVSGTVYSRSLWLRLETPTVSNGSTFALNASNRGLLTSTVLGSPATYRQYSLNTGDVTLTPVANQPGQFTLALATVLGSVATNQVLSGPTFTAVDNKATTQVQVRTVNGNVPITMVQQDVDWI